MNRPRRAPVPTVASVTTAATVVLATVGGLLAAAGPASAAVTCVSPVFKRTFYANTTFSGTPKRTDCDGVIDQDWGTGAPAVAGMPANYFGVRWAMTRDFGSGGPFQFTASSRDGIRVYVDGVRKVDLWRNVSSTVSKTVNLTIPAGRHSLRVDFVNWTGAANVKFAYAPRTSATVDTVKPLAPTGAAVTYDPATGATRFTWAKNKEMDLAGYKVYRRLKGTSYPAKPLATTTATSYTDTTAPKDGNVYYYEVRAYDKAGNVSSGTADLGVTTVDRTAPAAPKGVEGNWAMGSPENVTLYWDGNTEPDLAGYHLYRSTSFPVARTAGNRLTGAPLTSSYYSGPLPQTGDVYYYVATAVDTHGNESAPSGTAMYYSDDHTGPVNTAHNLRAGEDEAGVTLSWDASAVSSADFAGYAVYRSAKPRTAGVTGTLVGEHVYGTSFTDAAPPPGVTYYYSVIAVDHEGNGGPPSNEVAVDVAGNTTAPAAVTGLTAVPEENGVALAWDDASGSGLDHYLVLRGTRASGEEAWKYTPVSPQRNAEPSFHDTVAADGEQVRYAVIAVDQYGNQLTVDSGASVVDVTELDLRPTGVPAATGAPLTYLSAGPHRDLHWALPSDRNDSGSPLTGFDIRRWNPQSKAFELIASEPADSQSFYDLTQPSATTVYYRLTVRYADGTESGASEVVAVTS
ncbi:PA14 domain-containing protein [Streptomyces flavalbus]|uniref:PA14 domain-containing protein n=1 Tax=Streptomyces flavalbus TaxID=2665155 RepID=A0ABW2W986_9ACTN